MDICASIHIVNEKGLHARAAAAVARLAATFDARVTLNKDGFSAPATSITEMLMLGACCGSVVGIAATGPDAENAVAALKALAASGFGENPA